MADLTVSDHTAIIEFLIEHRDNVLGGTRSRRPETVLRHAASLTSDRRLAASLHAGTAAAATARRLAAAVPVQDPQWQAAIPTFRRIARYDGDTQGLIRLAEKEARGVQPPLRAGYDIGVDILVDGRQTIYEPDFWIAAKGIWPADVFSGNLASAVTDLVNRAADVGKADLVGAIAGAVGSIVTGEARAAGAVAGPIGAAAAVGRAALGAGTGASAAAVVT